MSVRLDIWGAETAWYRIPAYELTEIGTQDELEAYFERCEESGWMPDHVGSDVTDLTMDEAMFIASQYGGGEYDGEMGGVVLALCALRDFIASQGVTS